MDYDSYKSKQKEVYLKLIDEVKGLLPESDVVIYLSEISWMLIVIPIKDIQLASYFKDSKFNLVDKRDSWMVTYKGKSVARLYRRIVMEMPGIRVPNSKFSNLSPIALGSWICHEILLSPSTTTEEKELYTKELIKLTELISLIVQETIEHLGGSEMKLDKKLGYQLFHDSTRHFLAVDFSSVSGYIMRLDYLLPMFDPRIRCKIVERSLVWNWLDYYQINPENPPTGIKYICVLADICNLLSTTKLPDKVRVKGLKECLRLLNETLEERNYDAEFYNLQLGEGKSKYVYHVTRRIRSNF